MILSTMTGGISRKLGDEKAIKMLAEQNTYTGLLNPKAIKQAETKE